MFHKIFKSEISRLFLLTLSIYAFHFFLRIWSSPNLGDGDGYQALLLDSLRIGYEAGSGPFYTWLLYFFVHVFGYSVASFLILKYAILLLIYIVLYYGYLIFSPNKRYAFLCSFSLGSLYFLMWRMHEVMTDRLLTTLIVLLCFYVFFAKKKSADFDFVNVTLLGCLFGLGFLTEVYFLVSLCGFLIFSAKSRVNWKFFEVLIAALLGTLIALPFLAWLHASGESSQYLLGMQIWPSVMAFNRNDIRTALLHPLYVLSPAILILLPLMFGRVKLGLAEWQQSKSLELKRYFAVNYFLWLIAFGLLAPMKNTEAHTAMTLFLPVFILVFLRLESLQRSVRAIFFLLLIFPLIAVVFRLGNLLVEEPFCRNCRWSIPYKELASSIEKNMDLKEGAVVCSSNVDVLANLKLHLPFLRYSLGACDKKLGYIHIEELHGDDVSAICAANSQSILFKTLWAQPHWRLRRGERERYSNWIIETNMKTKSNCQN